MSQSNKENAVNAAKEAPYAGDLLNHGLDDFAIGKFAIVRTNTAGVWCGRVMEKLRNEVVLAEARRMWRWWARESISLSAVAVYGIRQDNSLIAPPVELVWLEAIEIIPVEGEALASIMTSPIAEQLR